MTDYTKATEFTPKDSLPTGDPNKIIKGLDFDTEFDAIETAISTKVDIVPSLSVGALLTAAIGGQLSDDKTAALDAIHPVNSIYISTDSANPATTFGAGTWQAFSQGRVLMGAGASTVDTNGSTISATAGTERGEYRHTLTEAEMPSHTHDTPLYSFTGTITNDNAAQTNGTSKIGDAVSDAAGSGQSHNNEQPSIVVYIWKRVA